MGRWSLNWYRYICIDIWPWVNTNYHQNWVGEHPNKDYYIHWIFIVGIFTRGTGFWPITISTQPWYHWYIRWHIHWFILNTKWYLYICIYIYIHFGNGYLQRERLHCVVQGGSWTYLTMYILTWFVVWNMIFIFPFSGECHHPNWLSYFKRGWNHQADMLSMRFFSVTVLQNIYIYINSSRTS